MEDSEDKVGGPTEEGKERKMSNFSILLRDIKLAFAQISLSPKSLSLFVPILRISFSLSASTFLPSLTIKRQGHTHARSQKEKCRDTQCGDV